MTTATTNLDPETIIGPYSLWPKQAKHAGSDWLRVIKTKVTVVSALTLGTFIHCGLPLLT